MFTDKPTRKSPLGRPRHRSDDNIKIDFIEIVANTRNWIDLLQDRDYWKNLQNAALSFQIT